MKKVNRLVLMSALTLSSGAFMVSCSSDDVADAPVNPTYDGKSVKTQFALNVAMPQGTRMSAANTQQSGESFLGMSDIHLFPFKDEPGTSSVTSTRNISLGVINTSELSSKSYTTYANVEIPVGTKYFLFYGFGPKGGDADEKFAKGVMDTSFPGSSTLNVNPSAITASLQNIPTTNLTTYQGYFTAYLNAIKDAQTSDATPLKWSETTDISLSDAYRQFTTINGVRCGSANAILKTVERLYNVADKAKTASSDQKVKDLAEAIKTAITPALGDIKVTVSGSAGNYTLAYENSDAKYSFPTNINLPEGAAQLTYSGGSDGSFGYKNAPSLGTGTNILDITKLTYPSSIAYTANTTTKATDSDITTWPSSTGAWDTDSWTGWNDEVKSTTRTVALKNNINYSVACMKTTVKCGAGTLVDNRAAIINDETTGDQNVNVPGGGFKVTAVLVGGQPNTVDWQFLDKSSARDAVIYDKELSGIVAKSGTYSDANYTLVFDSWDDEATQKDIMIAIELENNSGEDFYGVNGIILKNQKFYLVAKLSASDGGPITWPATAYNYPENGTKRVFMQDYTTEVNLNITSLKNAYSTIPDLRSIELKLGLSVDLQWRNGLVYNVDIN